MTEVVYNDRDLSWLSFNERVLEEAADPTVPLAERVKFLAIFSANLDEFYRVRVVALRSLTAIRKKKHLKHLPTNPQTVLDDIARMVARQQRRFGALFDEVLCPELRQQQVVLYRQEPVADTHQTEMAQFFRSTVLSYLQPVFMGTAQRIKRRNTLPLLDSQALYFALTLQPKAPSATGNAAPENPDQATTVMAYLNIPRNKLPRFVALSPIEGITYFAFLDDVIRANVGMVFPGYAVVECHSFKMNRAEGADITDEYRGNLVKKIKNQLDRRKTAPPIRFLYDQAMPPDLLTRLTHLFRLQPDDLVAGGRYHGMSDLMKLPLANLPGLVVPKLPALPVADLEPYESLFEAISERDWLLHFPYQSYSYVLRFFNEAAIDPLVYSIQVTLYRIATDSLIANALISAARNGKRVTVFVEVKARFDEANNLRWAEEMERAGVTIIYSMPGVKVHAKVALVRRRHPGLKKKDKPQAFAYFSTGNFNEVTATIYTDQGLFTAHAGLANELADVFRFLKKQTPVEHLKHLLVAPFNLQTRYLALIDREIQAARQGQEARLTIKLNGLEEQTMIDKLYEANQAGVRVTLLIRGICCLVPDVPGLSEGMVVVRLVDQHLEHSRVAVFHNGGQPAIYLASADWMNRNLYHRIEVGFPIYDPRLQQELLKLIDLQLHDTAKARRIDEHGQNQPIPTRNEPAIRAQVAMYEWLRDHVSNQLSGFLPE